MSAPMPDTLRAVADLIADAVRYGLPEPQSIHLSGYDAPRLIMRGDRFTEVEVWASYLQSAPVERYDNGEIEFIAADADVTDVYGISVRVTTNRPIVAEVTA